MEDELSEDRCEKERLNTAGSDRLKTMGQQRQRVLFHGWL
jgi:hypothetical protein